MKKSTSQTTEPLGNILLAEDDLSTRSFIDLMLTKAGYQVTACEDGEKAFSALINQEESNPFDLLLTDIVMPNMDGIELAQKAMMHLPSIKILYITGFSGTDSSPHASKRSEKMEKDLSQVVPKPFHMNSLLEKISDILQKAP